MGEKIAKTGIKRENDLMYYIKGGDVWAVPRKKPGQPKGKAAKVAAAGIEMDYGKYLYDLDGDGDVARKERQVGGSKRKKAAPEADRPVFRVPRIEGDLKLLEARRVRAAVLAGGENAKLARNSWTLPAAKANAVAAFLKEHFRESVV